MRTVRQRDLLTPELILLNTPVPKLTQASEEEVLVKVAATALCSGELEWASRFPDIFPQDKKPVPGQDIAGTVVFSGPKSAFRAGDEVFCRIDASRPGGMREYTVALESELALKPASMDWISAAATPLSALTAWQALFYHGSLEKDALFGDRQARARNATKKILITAAGGSVGGFAVQFSVCSGAKLIVGVCGTDKVEQVLGLGATTVVDYKKQKLENWVDENPKDREVDIVIDCAGGDTMAGLWRAIKDGGDFISISDVPDRLRPAENVKELKRSKFFIVSSLGSQLTEISQLLDHGLVKPLLDSVYAFEDYQQAFLKLDQGSAKGKIVIKVAI
ncbi:hypothetical protein E4U57_006256 [Claviceps arundinis]|uniref:Enoyl reductase (ER) domain-containing protein n=1 Tax=Claviceps arundinis TaxID=1623583 RepID=A0A9P7MRS6_9HYPO|nr:hypothetical protein E4U57_006256 [Claviceps arundinis]KAG5964641.1 hypothetical protein E4U56_002121 [Claviceps arundinis]